MKYDNLFDYDFIREMRDNFQREFILPEEEEEEIFPIRGMLGVVDDEENFDDDDDDDEFFYWEIDHIFIDENFLDEQYNYLYEIDNLFNYKRINDDDIFIMLKEDIFN